MSNKIIDMASRINKIVDSLVLSNSITGQGSSHDPAARTRVAPGAAIPQLVQTALYSGSAIARNIVTKYPDTALAKSININISDADLADKLLMQMEGDDLINKVRIAGGWARNFGGAGIVFNIDDGRDPSEPIDVNNYKIISSNVYHAHQLQIQEYESNPSSPNYCKPTLYNVLKETPFSYEMVPTHASRIVVFRGLDTTIDEQKKRQGWDLCVYDLINETLNQYNTVYYSAADMINRANQGIYKISDLEKLLASNSDEVILARYSLMDKLRSNFRALVIGEKEDFRYESIQVQGIADLLDKYTLQLSQASGIPVVILTGQSPSGLSATGEADLRMWNASVVEYYTRSIKKQLEDIALLYMTSWGFEEPEKWSIDIPSPWNLTPSEITAEKQAVISSDGAQIADGRYSKEEVVLFRSQENGYEKDLELTDAGRTQREHTLLMSYATQLKSNAPETLETKELPPAENTNTNSLVTKDSKKKTDYLPAGINKVCICGGPKTGKTTASRKYEHVIHTDDYDHLGWSQSSEYLASRLDEPLYVMEGVTTIRALRKWMNHNPGKPCDLVIYYTVPFGELSTGQAAMQKAQDTIFNQIKPELINRGVMIEE